MNIARFTIKTNCLKKTNPIFRMLKELLYSTFHYNIVFLMARKFNHFLIFWELYVNYVTITLSFENFM